VALVAFPAMLNGFVGCVVVFPKFGGGFEVDAVTVTGPSFELFPPPTLEVIAPSLSLLLPAGIAMVVSFDAFDAIASIP